DLEIIQEEDTHPSIDTSLNHEEDDLEMDEPQSEIIPIRRSTRTRHPTDRMCLYIDAEEHDLGDLDIRAIRILIAIAAYYEYEIWQLDVKTASLIGYLNEELRVSCYTDAGYLMNADDLKSQTGYVFVLNGGDVDCMSTTRQRIFATSYAESKTEYIGL
ncbi:hypothetical protein Tco_0803711, partial [Tanacetum coccineum]